MLDALSNKYMHYLQLKDLDIEGPIIFIAFSMSRLKLWTSDKLVHTKMPFQGKR